MISSLTIRRRKSRPLPVACCVRRVVAHRQWFILAVLAGCMSVLGCAGSPTPAEFGPPPSRALAIYLAEFNPVRGGHVVTDPQQARLYVPAEPVLTEADLAEARRVATGVFGDPGIALTLQPDAADRLARLTADHLGKPLVILIEGRVVHSARLVQPVRARLTVAQQGWTIAEVERIIAGLRPE